MKEDDLNAFGYVLAGGASRRMGRDKALVRFRGRLLIETALATLREAVSAAAIVGNRPDLAGFAEVVPDAMAGFGPVAGLVAGAAHCPRAWALFMPVDLPLLSGETLLQMLRSAEAANALCAVAMADDVPQPLCVVVHRTLHAALREQMLREERKVMHALEGAAGSRLIFVPVREREQFVNLNTAQELAEYDDAEAMAE